MSVLSKKEVLVINRNWEPVNVCSVEQAITRMSSDAVRAFQIEYPHECGEPNFTKPSCILPVSWEQWVELPVRDCDKTGIGTPRGVIRVPTVVIASKYKDVRLKVPSLNLRTIYERDKGTCQWSGKTLSRKDASIDHVFPRSKGGDATAFENCVLADRKINSDKGDLTPAEFTRRTGFKLKREPFEPAPVRVSALITNDKKIPDWEFFIYVKS